MLLSGGWCWCLLATGLLIPGMASAGDEPEPTAKLVSLTIDFGDGFQKRFTSLKWHEKMTVLDAMKLAADHPRGIRFEHRGSKATGFLTSIDGVKNEGRGRNWIYRVNGKLGDRSFAARNLVAGDAVLWKFGKYR